ncbi:organomercurial lyase [Actinomadura sp. SCN-SB]|uniref:organomercurial lyase n=1 Tax=Actinomadura sp. SCN-SB TaxID=3373092 RepID=UPI0037510006
MTTASPRRPDGAADSASTDAFEDNWRTMFTQHRHLFDLIQAVIALTAAGDHPAPVPQLAAALHRTPDDTRRLIDTTTAGVSTWGRIWHDGQHAHLDMAAPSTPRYQYRIGQRTIGVSGCAPDTFLVAQALDQPLRVQSTCPVTAAPITVDFSPTGLVEADPADTVVALIDPAATPGTILVASQQLDPAAVDRDACSQQPFFASAEASRAWRETHPTGRVLPVADLNAWWRRLRAETTAVPAPAS